jgi:hypothetical protein
MLSGISGASAFSATDEVDELVVILFLQPPMFIARCSIIE